MPASPRLLIADDEPALAENLVAELTALSAPYLTQARQRGATVIGVRTPTAPAEALDLEASLSWPIDRVELESILRNVAMGAPLGAERPARRRDPQAQFPGMRVLVADDNVVNQEVAKEALARLGAETVVVEDGAKAIAAFAASRFDLVFLDGSMPVLDGFEAARRIRFVNIGSMAGLSIPLAAGPLRSSGLELMGSGLGSVSHADLVKVIGELLKAIGPAKLKVDAVAMPMSGVEAAWAGKSAQRIVLTF